MATAKKLPSGEWRIQKYIGKDDNGKRIYKYFTASTKKEVEYLAAEFCIEYEKQKKKENNPYVTMTVYEAMAAYIESKSNVLSPSTIFGYEVVMRNRFHDLRDVVLSDLTNTTIQKSINREAAHLSPKTLANSSGFLSAVLRQYHPDFHYNVTLPAKKKKIKDLPSPEAVLTAVKGSDIELPVLLAMWLSLRMSEVRGLRKQDITADGHIILNQTKLYFCNTEYVRENTKTEKSTRKLRLPQYIMNLIDQFPQEQEYLVPARPYIITERFEKLLKTHGIDHMTFHELRHLNASIMVMLKIPDKYAMERGGWSTPDVLQSVYQHTFSDERKAVDDQIDNFFNSIIK